MMLEGDQKKGRPSCGQRLESIQLGSLTVWISRPHSPDLAGCLRRPEVEAPVVACLSRDEFGPPLAPVLVGPPGSGKTTLAELIAQTLGKPFFRCQCNDSVTAEDFLCVGRIAPSGVEYVLQSVSSAMVWPGLVLVDDIDKVDAKASSVFLPILDGEETIQSSLLGGVLRVHPDFRLVFACNDLERLPVFLRTRLVSFKVGYPAIEEVVRMAQSQVHDTGESLRKTFLESWDRRNGSKSSLAPREAVRIFQLAAKLGKAGHPVAKAMEEAMDAVLQTSGRSTGR